MHIGPEDALIVVDVQNDFAPGGALPVNDARLIVPPINDLAPFFETLVCSRDWHPSDHCSFDIDPGFVDGSWPSHCVQDTPGAEFLGDLHVPVDAIIVSKGTDPDKEAYSGFDDSDLADVLRDRGIRRVFVCGLATDYCVKATALDAKKLGFDVVVLLDACRGIDVPHGTVAETLDAFREAAIVISHSEAILR